MRTTQILILFLGLTSLLSAQKEDFQWYFNFTSVDDVSSISRPELRNASILDFNSNPPVFFQQIDATLDMDWTHASICDSKGELLLYSNGMSIHGPNHTPIAGGEKISFGPRWNNNTWPNEDGDLKPTGFLGTDCAVFVPKPGDDNRIYHIYYNFDDFELDGHFRKLYAEIDIIDPGNPQIVSKDNEFLKTTNPSSSSSAQHANGRDWWLLQFSRDTLFSFLVDTSGINLHHTTKLPFIMDDGQSTSVFSDDGSKYAVHGIAESNSPNGLILTIFDFDRCSGDLSNTLRDTLSSENIFGTPGSAFSASGQYLYLNDELHCWQYDLWSDDILESRDTVMVYNGQSFYEPSENIKMMSTFGLMRKGPDNKIYISQPAQGYHCLLYTSPSPRDATLSRMPSSA